MGVKPSDRLIYQAGMNRIPISGTFELSPMCNFSCRMCYVRRSPAEVARLGGLHPPEQWLAWAEEARQAGMLWLLLTGGEPFLYPGFLDLYEKLAKLGFFLSINTNGSLIDDPALEVLKQYLPKRVNLTLYGASGEAYGKLCGDAGAFHRVMDNARRLRENGIPYKYNFSLTKENYGDLSRVVALAEEQGVPVEVASYMFPPLRRDAAAVPEDFRLSPEQAGFCAAESMRLRLSPEEFHAYAVSVQDACLPPPSNGEGREMGCRAGRCSFWLNWQGNLTSCGMLDKPAVSLLHTSFSEGWQQIVQLTEETRCLSGCGGCPNYPLCHPCLASACCETGDGNGRPEYKCKMLLAEAAACKDMLKKIQG